MSKILKPFIAFFRLVYRIIDRLIVTPISRIIYKINEFSRDNSGKLEKVLNRPNVLIYVSLVCAIIVFLLIDSQVINLTEREAEIITGQDVSVLYNEEAYVVEGVPESVDITLIGSKSTIYLATQLYNHQVVLDLSNYGPGTYKVKLKYKHSVQAVDYKLDPSTVTVKISEKVSVVKPLSADIMNEDKLDSKLSISDIKLSTNEVIVKSSQEILNRVAVVKALIDASQIDLKESGEFTIDSVTLVAYDEYGEKIKNVEMVPSKISATVSIDSYHATKQVRIVTQGAMSNGKAIASITSSVKEVEVYGEKAIVDNLNNIEAQVSIDNLTDDKQMSVNLVKPSGVRYMSDTTTNISIVVGDSAQKTISGVTVNAIGVGSGLSASVNSNDEKSIDVIVQGVSSVINTDIKATDIIAEVDLSGLKEGTHTVPVKVSIDDERISVQPLKTEITVKIVKR